MFLAPQAGEQRLEHEQGEHRDHDQPEEHGPHRGEDVTQAPATDQERQPEQEKAEEKAQPGGPRHREDKGETREAKTGEPPGAASSARAETRRTAEKMATSSMNAARRLASGKVDFAVTECGPT